MLKKNKKITFPPFVLDASDERLWHGDNIVALRPKSFAVLKYLVERPGRLVTKDELLDALWPETSVSDTVLKGCVREIREALKDDPKVPKFIETGHRRGYRFIAKINEQPELILQVHSSSVATPNAQFVGRESEIAHLRDLLGRVMEGHRQIIFVTGEPGIGKTALVDQLLGEASGAALIARGQCLQQYGAGEAYLPVLEALSRMCREPDSERLMQLLRSQAPTWLLQMPWLISDTERKTLSSEVLGATRERMLREIAEVIESLTADTPFVLALEDLHWSDNSTLDFVALLARRSERARFMLVATYRPADLARDHPLNAISRELQLHRRSIELPLQFLSEEDVAEYVRSRLGGDAAGGLPRFVHQRAGGNPLFMVNVVDYLVDKGLIQQREGSWELTSPLDEVLVGVPNSIRRIIEQQIEALTSDQQQVLEAASATSSDFSVSTIAAALERDLVEVEDLCEALVRRSHFLRRAGEADDLYRFIHALYQTTLYDRIGAARRVQLHRRIGRQLETDLGDKAPESSAELAMHFERARDYSQAVRYLQVAADNALRRFANHEAVALSRRALELLALCPESVERSTRELSLLVTLAAPLAALEGYAAAEVERTYKRAHGLCQPAGHSANVFPVLYGLWRFYLLRASLTDARDIAEQMLRLSESELVPELAVEAHFALGVSCVNQGEFDGALNNLQRGIDLYDPKQRDTHLMLYGHDPGVVCRSFGAWAAWSLGFPDRAVEMTREAERLARECRHAENLGFALFFTAWVRQLRRETQEMQEHAELLIKHAREQGIAQWLAFGTILRAFGLAKRGDHTEGINQIRQTLSQYRAIGSEVSRPHFLGLLAEALSDAGRFPEAAIALEEALSAAETTGGHYYEAELYRLLATVTAQGADAEEILRKSLAVARQQRARSFELRTSTSLARLLQKQKRSEEASTMLQQVCAAFTEGFETTDFRDARSVLTGLG